jgi:hypothetical protein
MRTKISDQFDLIGKRLRDDWCDLENAPLPERIRLLVIELDRDEKAPLQSPSLQKRVH